MIVAGVLYCGSVPRPVFLPATLGLTGVVSRSHARDRHAAPPGLHCVFKVDDASIISTPGYQSDILWDCVCVLCLQGDGSHNLNAPMKGGQHGPAATVTHALRRFRHTAAPCEKKSHHLS